MEINNEEEVFRNKLNNLLSKQSLYTKIELTENEFSFWRTLFKSNLNVKADIYCINCKKETTFLLSNPNLSQELPKVGGWPVNSSTVDEKNIFQNKINKISGYHSLFFECLNAGSNKHKYVFTFFVEENTLNVKKVGQYPSLLDLQRSKSEKYKKLLGEDYSNFTKAIGLYASGVGIGSYVYLRRIFENLIIEEGNEIFPDDKKIEFNKTTMEKKIKLLKDVLPNSIFENKQVYAILSIGIHELSEEDCLEYFQTVKNAIEMILDYKLYKQDEEKKIKETRNELSRIKNIINID